MTDEKITKAQRWLDLIACLLGRRTPMTVEQIFEAVPAYRRDAGPEGDPDEASVRRKFERDKDELRDFGIPIDTVERRVNYGLDVEVGYQLRPGAFYMPYLEILEASADDESPGSGGSDRAARPARSSETGPVFTREELEIALEALAEAADIPGSPLSDATRSAYRKLAFDLESPPGDPALLRVTPPGADELDDTLQRINDALLRRKRIEFAYHGLARGEATERDVAPYGLMMEEGTWYLIGHDALRDGIRMFHVGRMEEPRVNTRSPATPDYEIPEDFSLSDYRDREAWELDGADRTRVVRVGFAHPMSLWAARNGFGELEAEEEAGAVRRFEVGHVHPFLCWILGLRGAAWIIDPPELADELKALAESIGALHE